MLGPEYIDWEERANFLQMFTQQLNKVALILIKKILIEDRLWYPFIDDKLCGTFKTVAKR